MSEIRTNISPPSKQTKVCLKCLKNKPIDGFSLVRGKHSEDRKSYCVQCEGLMKKARREYDLELEQYIALLRRPCSVCGDKSSHIDKAERVNGVLCKRCWSFLKSVLPTNDIEVVTSCYNYLVFREKFPFWLKLELSQSIPEPETPLFDGIE